VTNEEFETFKEKFPDVARILLNPDELIPAEDQP